MFFFFQYGFGFSEGGGGFSSIACDDETEKPAGAVAGTVRAKQKGHYYYCVRALRTYLHRLSSPRAGRPRLLVEEAPHRHDERR